MTHIQKNKKQGGSERERAYEAVYFWRRFGAYSIDFIIVLAIATAFYAPLVLSNSDRFRFDTSDFFGILLSVNREATTNETAFFEAAIPEASDFVTSSEIVSEHVNFLVPNGEKVKFDFKGSGASSETKSYIEFPLSKFGGVATPFYLDGLIFSVGFLFLMPFLRMRSPTSLGKRLFGIELKLVNDQAPTYWLFTKREMIRSWPVLMTFFSSIWLLFHHPTSFQALQDGLNFAKDAMVSFRLGDSDFFAKISFWDAVSEGIFTAAFCLWCATIVGFAAFHLSRMPWDLWAGTRVERVSP